MFIEKKTMNHVSTQSPQLIPGRVVSHDLVHVADVHHILGLALVVGHAGVLKPVAPEDFIGEVARPHLEDE